MAFFAAWRRICVTVEYAISGRAAGEHRPPPEMFDGIHMNTQEHRIELTYAPDHVVVRVNDTVVATSSRALVLTETNCPPRYYLPQEDVKMDLLRSTTTTSHCPYKGDAVYWSVDTGEAPVEDVVWSYPEPFAQVEQIRGRLAFWAEKPGVTLEVNGQVA
ncbi:DUF427 domain-containing protein [Microbispora sp. KK1-11]|uniref:DUF427 domain-containing protein n=1 Tax=Microbispora sp. KK1-11 TaxID=2053005 RepID=UPI001C8E6279|nr:DUF427 domain-containing protein [Microbispora sp. KK1-11]